MPDGIRLPGAIWKPFTKRSVSTLHWSGPGAIIGHTMVGSRDGSWDYHNEPGMPYVQLYYDHMGVPFQTTGLEYRAAGTLELNPYVIAIEVADKGPGFAAWDGKCGHVPPMTDAQVKALIRDVAWMCVALGIEPRRMANSCEALPGGPGGIGVHRDSIDPWRVDWCPKGSNYAGKCCPDSARISQWENLIIPGARALVHQEDDMTPGQERKLDAALAAANEAKFLAHALLDLMTPNGFLYVMPRTGEVVPRGTAGAKPAADVWRWARESVTIDREDDDRQAETVALLEYLKALAEG